jgi:hypothetical protein
MPSSANQEFPATRQFFGTSCLGGTASEIDLERRAAANELKTLLELLPKIDTAVLVGRTARAAEPFLQAGVNVDQGLKAVNPGSL